MALTKRLAPGLKGPAIARNLCLLILKTRVADLLNLGSLHVMFIGWYFAELEGLAENGHPECKSRFLSA